LIFGHPKEFSTGYAKTFSPVEKVFFFGESVVSMRNFAQRAINFAQ
jgi:hypothetical protein